MLVSLSHLELDVDSNVKLRFVSFQQSQQLPSPELPSEPPGLFNDEGDMNSNSASSKNSPLIKMYNQDYMVRKNPSTKPRQVFSQHCCSNRTLLFLSQSRNLI